MKKLTRFMLVLVFFVSAMGWVPADAAALEGNRLPSLDDQPPAPLSPDATRWVYLPIVATSTQVNTVHGQVTDTQGGPIAGVTVTSSTGEVTTTNANGDYNLGVSASQVSLAPSKTGFMFTPSMLEVSVTGTSVGQDFTAVADCAETISNGSFESNTWWNLVDSGVPSVYANWLAHSGARSVLMGVSNPVQNALAESRLRSSPITVPGNVTSATLRLWLYPVSSESPTTAIDKSLSQVELTDPISPFGDQTTLYDAQYVRVLDTNNTVIGTLLYMRSNNQYWNFHQFDLTPFAGRTIKLEIGAYNDGTDGITSLYVDDVSLAVCAAGPVPPPPPVSDTCANQVANSGFEYNGSWNLPYTAYPAGYSYDAAHTGSRSMRTGIPLYTSSSVYSYSDAWQLVYIPTGTATARLKMWLYPRSEEVAITAAPESSTGVEAGQIDPNAPAEGSEWNEKPLAPDYPDAQYVLLLNSAGSILRTLEWWTPRNASGWLYREYDVSAYAGQYIRVQVGAYNDGVGGRSVLYVDDVSVEVCTTPPPPATCSQRISNGGFENNNAWYIPYTAFSAGYSTWIRRSGVRSMRTGIVYSYHNRYSYSDVRQTVTIPSGVSSATLSFYAYSMTTEAYADVAMTDPLTPAQMAAASPTSGDLGAEAMAGDVQYLLVLDRYGNWIDTLVWRRANDGFWRNFSFNLNRYRGQTIMLQWGTFNNGYGGVTSLYIDDVSLQACP